MNKQNLVSTSKNLANVISSSNSYATHIYYVSKNINVAHKDELEEILSNLNIGCGYFSVFCHGKWVANIAYETSDYGEFNEEFDEETVETVKQALTDLAEKHGGFKALRK